MLSARWGIAEGAHGRVDCAIVPMLDEEQVRGANPEAWLLAWTAKRAGLFPRPALLQTQPCFHTTWHDQPKPGQDTSALTHPHLVTQGNYPLS